MTANLPSGHTTAVRPGRINIVRGRFNAAIPALLQFAAVVVVQLATLHLPAALDIGLLLLVILALIPSAPGPRRRRKYQRAV